MSPPDPRLPISNLSAELFMKLTEKLKINNGWKSLAVAFNFYGDETLQRFESIPDPADELLNGLTYRECTVGLLTSALQELELLDALSLLKAPEPLVIIQQPGSELEPIRIDFGDELSLVCLARGLPPPHYQWYFGNKELESQRSSKLLITDFREEHVGDYSCCVTQRPTGIECWSNLVTVEFLPEVPQILEQPSPVTCVVGDKIELCCKVDCYPVPEFQWYHGNTMLPGETDSTLCIRKATLSDRGEYRCYIQNMRAKLWTDEVTVQVYETSEDYEPKVVQRKKVTGKVALLIANEHYSVREFDNLYTPCNDVQALSEVLATLGFKVLALHNLTKIEMKNALQTFSDLLEEGSYGIFYFAGHGFEMLDKFMLPVDAPDPGRFLRSDCICEGEVLKYGLVKNPRLLFMILDMCLKVPEKTVNSEIHSETPEVYTYTPQRNLIKAYATTSNLGSYERTTDNNGIYMKHMKKQLGLDLPIREILDRVMEGIQREPEDVRDIQIPSVFFNASDLYLTDPVKESPELKNLYTRVTTLPQRITLQFRYIKPARSPEATFHRHRRCFHNSMDIRISNLDNWRVECFMQNKELSMIIERDNGDLVIKVFRLQKVKIPCLSLTISLFEWDTNKLVDFCILEMGNPLIIPAQLWYDSIPSDSF